MFTRSRGAESACRGDDDMVVDTRPGRPASTRERACSLSMASMRDEVSWCASCSVWDVPCWVGGE